MRQIGTLSEPALRRPAARPFACRRSRTSQTIPTDRTNRSPSATMWQTEPADTPVRPDLPLLRAGLRRPARRRQRGRPAGPGQWVRRRPGGLLRGHGPGARDAARSRAGRSPWTRPSPGCARLIAAALRAPVRRTGDRCQRHAGGPGPGRPVRRPARSCQRRRALSQPAGPPGRRLDDRHPDRGAQPRRPDPGGRQPVPGPLSATGRACAPAPRGPVLAVRPTRPGPARTLGPGDPARRARGSAPDRHPGPTLGPGRGLRPAARADRRAAGPLGRHPRGVGRAVGVPGRAVCAPPVTPSSPGPPPSWTSPTRN